MNNGKRIIVNPNDFKQSAVAFDHAEAGAMLLEHWRFPKAMCDTIRWQLFAGQPTEPRSLVSVLGRA